MVKRWNRNPIIGYAAASASAKITGEVYLYPRAEGNNECVPIGF